MVRNCHSKKAAVLPMFFDLQYLTAGDVGQHQFYLKGSDVFCWVDDIERQVVTLLKFNDIYKRSYLGEKAEYPLFIVTENVYKLIIAQLQQVSTQVELSDIQESVLKVIKAAIKLRVSDVHIVREDVACAIKFRINGSLVMHKEILSKDADSWMFVLYNVMATTKETTWNRRIPQDANVIINLDSGSYRLRYAHMPLFGESGQNYHAVLRLIFPSDKNDICLSYDQLRYDAASTALVTKILDNSHGLFVVSGVTGSGKSTSLKKYIELLYNVNHKGKGCFVTVEDPVEYQIQGVQQSSIVPDGSGGNPFAAAVRSAMRRDPDVIMIGEIRDAATIDALSSAVDSGHYCLTTIHAGSVIAVMQRLAGLGMKLDKLSSPGFLSGVTNQKLAPRLCDSCKVQIVDPDFNRTVFVANNHGCSECNNTGFSSRVLLIEFFVPTIKDLDLIAKQDWLGLYVQYREKKTEYDLGDGSLGEGFTLKDKAYGYVLDGTLCNTYFLHQFGHIDPEDEQLIYERHCQKIQN